MKVEPHEILPYLTDIKMSIVKEHVYVYGVSLGTETQLCKFDNPFMTLDDKKILGKTMVKILKKRIKKNHGKN